MFLYRVIHPWNGDREIKCNWITPDHFSLVRWESGSSDPWKFPSRLENFDISWDSRRERTSSVWDLFVSDRSHIVLKGVYSK